VYQSITDTRDGKRYEIIEIEGLKWFRDNLQFETDLSYCPNFSNDGDCKDGNFYAYTEIDKICPVGWRIPTDKEFEAYLIYRILQEGGESSDLVIDTLQRKKFSVNYIDSKDKVNLISEGNPLKLQMPGWVEGNKMARSQTVSIWVHHSEIEDEKFHVHITNRNYILHTHNSYIDDTEEKSRKLKVKCVSSVK
jgi:uncharacterized protein (TIGR02145 family)